MTRNILSNIHDYRGFYYFASNPNTREETVSKQLDCIYFKRDNIFIEVDTRKRGATYEETIDKHYSELVLKSRELYSNQRTISEIGKSSHVICFNQMIGRYEFVNFDKQNR